MTCIARSSAWDTISASRTTPPFSLMQTASSNVRFWPLTNTAHPRVWDPARSLIITVLWWARFNYKVLSQRRLSCKVSSLYLVLPLCLSLWTCFLSMREKSCSLSGSLHSILVSFVLKWQYIHLNFFFMFLCRLLVKPPHVKIMVRVIRFMKRTNTNVAVHLALQELTAKSHLVSSVVQTLAFGSQSLHYAK